MIGSPSRTNFCKWPLQAALFEKFKPQRNLVAGDWKIPGAEFSAVLFRGQKKIAFPGHPSMIRPIAVAVIDGVIGKMKGLPRWIPPELTRPEKKPSGSAMPAKASSSGPARSTEGHLLSLQGKLPLRQNVADATDGTGKGASAPASFPHRVSRMRSPRRAPREIRAVARPGRTSPVSQGAAGIQQDDIEIPVHRQVLKAVIENDHLRAHRPWPERTPSRRRGASRPAPRGCAGPADTAHLRNPGFEKRPAPRLTTRTPHPGPHAIAPADHGDLPPPGQEIPDQMIDRGRFARAPDGQVPDGNNRHSGAVDRKNPDAVKQHPQPADHSVQPPGRNKQKKRSVPSTPVGPSRVSRRWNRDKRLHSSSGRRIFSITARVRAVAPAFCCSRA